MTLAKYIRNDRYTKDSGLLKLIFSFISYEVT